MSRSQKIFLAVLSLYVIFDFILGSLVGLYLWETTKEASKILSYYIALFLSILLSTQFAPGFIGSYGVKKVYVGSIVIGMIQAAILMLAGTTITNIIIPFGILAGIGIGLQAMSYSIIVGQITRGSETNMFLGVKSSVINFVSIISVPLITSLISSLGSYQVSYYLSLLAGISIVTLISRIPITNPSTSTVQSSYSSLLQIEEVRIFATTRLFYGFYNGPMWAVLGVVTFMFIGDVAKWGYVSTSLTIASILSTYLYTKIRNISLQKAISTSATFVFASVALLLATNWNFIAFMAYQIVVVLLNSTFSLHYEGIIYSIVNENDTVKQNMSKVLSIGEIAMGIGRVVPLMILLILGFSFEDPLVLQILFVMISVIPLLILNKLSDIIPHSSRYVTIYS